LKSSAVHVVVKDYDKIVHCNENDHEKIFVIEKFNLTGNHDTTELEQLVKYAK